ncbi:MAG: selenoprotein O, partial [Pseudomonadota bacterium]
ERVFFDWFGAAASSARRENSPLAAPYRDVPFADIAARLTAQTPDRPERLEAEYFQQEKPCTMLIDEVESLWAAIADDDDWAPLTQKLTDIKTMRTAFGFSQEFAAPGA